MLKTGIVAALAAIAMADTVTAADAPTGMPRKAPQIAQSYDWSGFYFGGHVGYGRGNAATSVGDPAAPIGGDGFGSLIGGMQLGYNYVLPSRLLVGLEADVTFPNFWEDGDIAMRSTAKNTVVFERYDYLATLRGRIGYAFDHWLIYGTGGFAWSQARLLESPGALDDEDKILRRRAGWALGLGAEVAVASQWTARLEYLYARLGHIDVTFPSGTHYESAFDIHSLRLGLNRRLDWLDSHASARALQPSSPIAPVDWNVHGQYTLVLQGYPSFRSPYEGPNSLFGHKQITNTMSATAFVGVRPWEGTEIYFNPEVGQGFGFNEVHGLGGFSNGEAQKASFPMPRLNMARMFVRQTFGLGGEQETIPDGPNQLPGKQDISRITITAGKLSVIDFFDGNAYSHDPRVSFLNWALMCCGAYDWDMDKISYTWGALVDFNQKHWAFRFGYFLVPIRSNDNNFDTRIPTTGEYIAELELRYSLFSQPGKLRLFGWANRANAGSYSEAIALPVTSPNYPDIALTRRVRTNYGFAANIEQAITNDLGMFSRVSWNAGHTEKIGWTDIDASVSLGFILKGSSWGRPTDKIGLAWAANALSNDARSFFAAGGLGILIGDGQLNYREEQIVEAYYAYSLTDWTTLTFDYQFIANPGYNADRGPVSIFSGRLHTEF